MGSLFSDPAAGWFGSMGIQTKPDHQTANLPEWTHLMGAKHVLPVLLPSQKYESYFDKGYRVAVDACWIHLKIINKKTRVILCECAYVHTCLLTQKMQCVLMCVCVCWLSSKVALYRSCQWEIQLTDCIPDVACTLCFQSVFQWWYAAKRLLTHIVLIQIMCVLMCVRNSKTLRNLPGYYNETTRGLHF